MGEDDTQPSGCGRTQERLRGLDRQHGVLVLREGRDEQADDLVADELVDDRVMVHEDARGGFVEPVELAPKFGRAHSLRQRRRAPNIGEEEARLDLRPAAVRVEDVEAKGAIQRILRPWISME
jgi:hypothetical protein